MDRRIADHQGPLRVRVDATLCDGQGMCALVADEAFALDRYGDAYVRDGATIFDPTSSLGLDILEAEKVCPRVAILIDVPQPRVARLSDPETPVTPTRDADERPVSLLHRPSPESLAQWQAEGGFSPAADVASTVDEAGLLGQGGARFPVSRKWEAMAGANEPILVVNAAEREPGTIKDRYLLAERPFLILDGAALAARAIGAKRIVVVFDADNTDIASRFADATAEVAAAGLLGDLDVSQSTVPAQYVAGEETALLSAAAGGKPLPRLRPPFPSEKGLYGLPTLLHNVETLAQVAVTVRGGADRWRSHGLATEAGTGLFSVGVLGGTEFTVVERPIGYPLGALLDETGLRDGAVGALVGGYAGGLLAPESFGLSLSSAALAEAGVSLGTKSVQVLPAGSCPVSAVVDIVTYFAGETANQCRCCYRGLPDMAGLLRKLRDGSTSAAELEDVKTFMGTIGGRGVCRLPDGAARVVLSLIRSFGPHVDAHLAGGCPTAS